MKTTSQKTHPQRKSPTGDPRLIARLRGALARHQKYAEAGRRGAEIAADRTLANLRSLGALAK
jgi:hypothetical protein